MCLMSTGLDLSGVGIKCDGDHAVDMWGDLPEWLPVPTATEIDRDIECACIPLHRTGVLY